MLSMSMSTFVTQHVNQNKTAENDELGLHPSFRTPVEVGSEAILRIGEATEDKSLETQFSQVDVNKSSKKSFSQKKILQNIQMFYTKNSNYKPRLNLKNIISDKSNNSIFMSLDLNKLKIIPKKNDSTTLNLSIEINFEFQEKQEVKKQEEDKKQEQAVFVSICFHNNSEISYNNFLSYNVFPLVFEQKIDYDTDKIDIYFTKVYTYDLTEPNLSTVVFFAKNEKETIQRVFDADKNEYKKQLDKFRTAKIKYEKENETHPNQLEQLEKNFYTQKVNIFDKSVIFFNKKDVYEKIMKRTLFGEAEKKKLEKFFPEKIFLMSIL